MFFDIIETHVVDVGFQIAVERGVEQFGKIVFVVVEVCRESFERNVVFEICFDIFDDFDDQTVFGLDSVLGRIAVDDGTQQYIDIGL